MSNFAKWSSENMPNKPIYGVYFASRNKDNQDVPDFKERRKVFLSTRSVDELMPEFKHFVNMGQPGEFSRFYISVNSRKNKNSLRDLQQYILDALLDNEILSIAAIQTKAAQVAMKPKNRETRKVLLDFDEDESKLDEFIQDAIDASTKHGQEPIEVEVYKTPNGHAVIASHGFDSREFSQKWGKDTVKTDALLCTYWERKEN